MENQKAAPNLQGEPGWTPIDIAVLMGLSRSFVSGDPEGSRLRLSYFYRQRDGALVGRVWFGPDAHGPPGFAHGGSIAAVLDELMGGAIFLKGYTVLARKIEVSFNHKIALGSVVTFEAWVDYVQPKIVVAKASLSLENKQMSSGRGVFVRVGEEHLGDLVKELPNYLQSIKTNECSS